MLLLNKLRTGLDMRWRLLPIILIAVLAEPIITGLLLRTRLAERLTTLVAYVVPLAWKSEEDITRIPFLETDVAEGAYPYFWQRREREHLRALCTQAERPPSGTDELALAQEADYALNHPEDREVIRAGMRRDPRNALYHYLLANADCHLAVTEHQHFSGVMQTTYHVKDRRLLDEGMHEVALGMQMPFRSRRGTLLRARMLALPPANDVIGYIRELQVTSLDRTPEKGIFREIACRNNFYLALLFAEGKRADALPLVPTGERLGIQLAKDDPASFDKVVVARALIRISQGSTVRICRKYGLYTEADTLETQCSALLNPGQPYFSGRKANEELAKPFCNRYAGSISGGALIPELGLKPGEYPLTVKALQPSRLIEYLLVEKNFAIMLLVVYVASMLSGGAYYLHLRKCYQGTYPANAILELRAGELVGIIAVGLVIPLVIYQCYFLLAIAPNNLHTRFIPFMISVMSVSGWIIFVPTMLVRHRLRKHAIAGRMTMAHYQIAQLFQEPKRPDLAVLQLSLSRATATVCALLALLTALLIPVCGAFERHYLQTDTLMGINQQGEAIGVPKIEGDVAVKLRNDILAKAKELHITVE